MKVSILKKPREEEWLMVKKAAFRTIGKDTEKLPSIEWKRRMLKAQHSPIRMLEYTFLLEDIPSWVSVHLVRHVHATPFVTTQRNDRMYREEGYDRRKAPQDTPVDMIWFVNAEELITIAHKRLCMLASPETRKVIQDICKAVLLECPEWQETGLLVPLCTYRNGLCDEFKPCDYYMKHGHGYVNFGAAVKPQVTIRYPEYFVNQDGPIKERCEKMPELIDREATLKKMCKTCGYCERFEKAMRTMHPDFVTDKCREYKFFAEQPAVESEPVRHGHWIWLKPYGVLFTHRRKCSECGEIKDQEATNFCPNCGAKMDLRNRQRYSLTKRMT